jgi:hypothetical protein
MTQKQKRKKELLSEVLKLQTRAELLHKEKLLVQCFHEPLGDLA